MVYKIHKITKIIKKTLRENSQVCGTTNGEPPMGKGALYSTLKVEIIIVYLWFPINALIHLFRQQLFLGTDELQANLQAE